MQPSYSPYTHSKYMIRVLGYSILCLNFALSACKKTDEKSTIKSNQKIELIQKDIIPFQDGNSVNKTPFIGTIRAINQSSIQARITATVTTVTVNVGQQVKQGDVLVQMNNQDNAARLAQAQANLATAQAQARQAQLMVERKKRLLNQGFISKVDYEQSQVDYQAQLENVHAQQANVNIAQKANLDGTIYSPISGVITLRQVEPGQTVTAGQTIFEIVDPNHLEIQAKLSSDQQAVLSLGKKIEYHIQGNPQTFTAEISRISPIADTKSRQIDFFARPLEAITSLSIGAYVEGEIFDHTTIQGQLIPLDTIQDIHTKPYVWVIRNHKIERAPITVLEQRYRDNIAVVKDLHIGDQISRINFTESELHKEVSINSK